MFGKDHFYMSKRDMYYDLYLDLFQLTFFWVLTLNHYSLFFIDQPTSV